MNAHINGVEIHYELTGTHNGIPVMFSHSLMADLTMWDRQMPALTEFQVLRYDTRGHGHSEAVPGPYTFEELAADAVALLDHLDIAKTHFVGLSMGGMIGQALAVHHPDRIARLVLCDTRDHSPPARAALREKRIALVQSEGLSPLVEGAIRGWFSEEFAKSDPEEIDRTRRMIAGTSPEGVIGCSHALTTHDYRNHLSKIESPTLIIVGQEDEGTPVSEARALHVGIRGSELIVLPIAKHLSNVECPELFNAALCRFLAAVVSA